jgi:HPt (histidine-containing phosphotransfer) domain-containing protein
MDHKTLREPPDKGNLYAPETLTSTPKDDPASVASEKPASTSSIRFDPRELDEQTLGQLEAELSPLALRRLVNLFIEETRTRLCAVTSARIAGDWQALRREAHSLKSAAGAFGAKRLQEHACRLDQCCINGDWNGICALAASIVEVANPALEALALSYPPLSSPTTRGPQK